MSKGRVVVIENDDWIARLLEEGLNDAGYEVTLASEALEGFQRACEKLPDCIICDVSLPDFDGYWVAHKVRADSSAVSTTPFLFLIQADDEASPLEAFNVGADVQLTKPFRLDEVVAQVGALVEMAKRLRKTRDSFLDRNAQPPVGEALRGDLAQMSIATVMALLEMERRSGQLQVSEGDGKSGSSATIDLASGFATGGTLAGASTGLLQILREIMKWKSGLLVFQVGKEVPPPNPRRPIGAILMEAVQLNATGPTPPQLVAKMTAARAAMQKGDSMLPRGASVMPKDPSLVPKAVSVAPKAASVAPKAASVAPKAASVAPKAASVAPKAAAVPKSPAITTKGPAAKPEYRSVVPKGVSVISKLPPEQQPPKKQSTRPKAPTSPVLPKPPAMTKIGPPPLGPLSLKAKAPPGPKKQ
jgi:DNA-binding response OmpR family regulator